MKELIVGFWSLVKVKSEKHWKQTSFIVAKQGQSPLSYKYDKINVFS